MKNRQKMRGWLMTMGMLLLSLIFLFPLYAIFIASLKPGADLMRHGLNVNWEPVSMLDCTRKNGQRNKSLS